MQDKTTTAPAEPALRLRALERGDLWADLKELYALVEYVQHRTAEVAAKLLGGPMAVSREDLERLAAALAQAQERVREAQDRVH